MSHYEEQLERDLEVIRGRFSEVATAVETALANSVHALLTGDHELAYVTVLGDLPINRAVREIDRLCHAFVARHLPSAGHLRFVSSMLRVNIALERIGDYAATICREAVQLSGPPHSAVARDVEVIAEHSRNVLAQAIRAFCEENAELARGTMGLAARGEADFSRIVADLRQEGEEHARPMTDLFALLLVFHRLERVSDQAKNVCEETIFRVTGETKQPKVYRILFVDAANDGLSLMAELYARRAFPESGQYASAGWSPAAAPHPGLVEFMTGRGFDLSQASPQLLQPTHDELAGYDVVVSLEGDPRAQLPQLPFHTVVLEWPLDPVPTVAAAEEAEPVLEKGYEEIKLRVRRLMELLRGEGAS